MKKSIYTWKISDLQPGSEQLVPWLESQDLPSFLAPILWNRQLQTEEELVTFFEPTIEALHDPFLIHDMEKAVKRIHEAVAEGQKILIYGDYDADGITSTTVLKEAIELLGGEVSFYLPDRFTDGYGPNKATYERLFQEEGVELLITVDNGVAGHEALTFAKEVGIDVIVTDHHEIPEELPSAYAIVHPRHPEGNYPFGDLAGVGVAFKVATALLETVPDDMLDLVAIGTIADLVSLTGENRTLVQLGLKILKQTERIGLHALCEQADLDLETLTEETIGFGIGPRLNAIGRLGDASPGVDLLSTFDEEDALVLATKINNVNNERQGIVKKIIKEAQEMIQSLPQQEIYVLAKEGWHEGVLGIVASKIVQETGRPALVLGIDRTKQVAKGSARSVDQVNLYEALSSVGELFINYGGHQMAAGMSLPTDHLMELQEGLNQYISEQGIDFSSGPDLMIEASLTLSEVTLDQIKGMKLLAPFGTDNPAPYFLFDKVSAKEVKQIGADQNHLKFQLKESATEDSLDCIAFGMGADYQELATSDDLKVVGQLAINEWNGRRKPQLLVKDYQIAGFQLFDLRGKKLEIQNYQADKTLFIISDKKYVKRYQLVPSSTIVLTGNSVTESELLTKNWEQAVIVDCPIIVSDLKTVLDKIKVPRLYLYAESNEQCYLNGMPSREQFGKLFKFIAEFEQVDVRYKLKDVAKFLKIDETLLIFMIQVFFDLGFVTIDSGIMTKVEEPEKKQLNSSLVYQQREQKIIAEKFLLYSSANELKNWLLLQEEK
ncbi:single-stranded-DNA-specific exonuclease RecJ [Vagococcus intermedius]|uniref:Single-stranded-DNA-specific exonuclease RecJ n=1 Tax=Vagococcus intermedius TaxID=2991418 RepID=A0AAF0I6X3_9ENTE|nr:single-stranded-DNA-specific exonuclease RecJ [Vagococcus intermedius]WEG72646.1 single-stranded-DNA-specific exonuclease RecJ [Vagococcus intermedius]WEG74731.1 single-stranded-DNA-specific exonuclease RecJ [Vagococcus intermedius]